MLGVWCLFYVGVKMDMWRLGYEMEDLESQRMVLKKQAREFAGPVVGAD